MKKNLSSFVLGIILVIAGYMLARDQYWGQTLVPGVGVIQEVNCPRRAGGLGRHKATCTLKIEYQNEQRQTQHLALSDLYLLSSHRAGDSIRIAYDPVHPERGAFGSTVKRYLFPLGLILAGLGTLGYGLFCLWRAMRRD